MDGHVTNVGLIPGRGGRGDGSIGASFVETELHHPSQARFFFFLISAGGCCLGVECDEGGGVGHEGPAIEEVLLNEEGEEFDVGLGEEHGLGEGLGEEEDGGVGLVGPHDADGEGAGGEVRAVEECLEEAEAAELVVGEEAARVEGVVGNSEGGVGRGEFESGEEFGGEGGFGGGEGEGEGLDLRVEGEGEGK